MSILAQTRYELAEANARIVEKDIAIHNLHNDVGTLTSALNQARDEVRSLRIAWAAKNAEYAKAQASLGRSFTTLVFHPGAEVTMTTHGIGGGGGSGAATGEQHARLVDSESPEEPRS